MRRSRQLLQESEKETRKTNRPLQTHSMRPALLPPTLTMLPAGWRLPRAARGVAAAVPPLMAARPVALPLLAPAAPLPPLLAAAAASLPPPSAPAAAGSAPAVAAPAALPPAQWLEARQCRAPMNALLTGRQLSVEMMPSLTVTAILTAVDRPLVAGPCLMQSGSKRAGDVSSGGGGRWQRESACAVHAALPTVAAHG